MNQTPTTVITGSDISMLVKDEVATLQLTFTEKMRDKFYTRFKDEDMDKMKEIFDWFNEQLKTS